MNIQHAVKNKYGFTLMEMIIALGVFSFLVLATLGMFASSIRGQRTALAQSKIEREAQLLVGVISKKIRSSRVNYIAYPSETVPTDPDYLYLIDTAGGDVGFRLNSDEIQVQLDGGSYLPISRDDIAVTYLRFFVDPTTDPFTSLGNTPTTQPRVTVVFTLESTGTEQATVTVQQSIPQRGGAY